MRQNACWGTWTTNLGWPKTEFPTEHLAQACFRAVCSTQLYPRMPVVQTPFQQLQPSFEIRTWIRRLLEQAEMPSLLDFTASLRTSFMVRSGDVSLKCCAARGAFVGISMLFPVVLHVYRRYPGLVQLQGEMRICGMLSKPQI